MSDTGRQSHAARLVILANYGGPYAGTFISMILAIVRESRQRGWLAEVILSSDAKERPWLSEFDSDHIPYRFAPDVSPISLGRWLAECVLDGGARTVLHSHFTLFDVPAALVSRGRHNVSVFWHIHSYALPQLNIRIRNVLKYALVGRLVKNIFCVAPDIAQAVRERGGALKRVVYVPNAVDTDRFSRTTSDERQQARRQLGLAQDERVVLHFGWDWQRKGGETFVQTIEMLINDGMPVLGLTVGGGDLARAAVAKRQVRNIRVLDPRNDVRTLYAAADVFLAPSVSEGMPFAIAEALCTGLPVVGSDIPGQAIIAQGINACRLTDRTPKALAAAICATLSRDSGTIESEARMARSEIVKRFDLRPWAARMVDYYDR